MTAHNSMLHRKNTCVDRNTGHVFVLDLMKEMGGDTSE